MKCGNCGIDFQSEESMVRHMVLIHNSPFDLTQEAHARYREPQEKLMNNKDFNAVKAALHGGL